MLPAGEPTERHDRGARRRCCSAGDIIIDGGNTFYKDDIRRAKALAEKGITYVDVGTSGGVWGLERGYCMMVGGDKDAVERLDPILDDAGAGPRHDPAHARPAPRATIRAPRRAISMPARRAPGHFVKMVHNGIEYGLMQAYAEGFDILKGKSSEKLPEDERFDLNLTDIAEVWRRGSVISSWLLDLTARRSRGDQSSSSSPARSPTAGEGQWTIEAAMEEAVPANVLTAALFARYRSRVETHLRRQAAVGDALRLRRPRRAGGQGMTLRPLRAAQPVLGAAAHLHGYAVGSDGPAAVPVRDGPPWRVIEP